MMLLAIDPTRDPARVVLAADEGPAVVREMAGDRHMGVNLLRAIDELCAEADIVRADIARIAVVPGPGRYTAIRAAVVTASMLAYAGTCELVQIESGSDEAMIRQAHDAAPHEHVTPVYE